jgi:competence protein ComEC
MTLLNATPRGDARLVQQPLSAHPSMVLCAWLVGNLLQLRQPALWDAVGYVLLGIAALMLLVARLAKPAITRHNVLSVRCSWRWLWMLVVPLLALGSFSFASAGWRAAAHAQSILAPALEGQDVVLMGVVSTLPGVSADGTRFILDVEEAWLQGQSVRVPSRVSLGWYANSFQATARANSHAHDESAPGSSKHPHAPSTPSVPAMDVMHATPEEPPRVAAGERWRLPVRMKRPHGVLNPHGWDAERWLFVQGVGGTGTVRSKGHHGADLPERLGIDASRWVQRSRQSVKDAVMARVADARAAGVLAALAVGDQSAIDRADWDVYRVTGVAHLMSISGLHVTMFAWFAALLVGALWRRSARASLTWPAPQAARWGGLALAAAYAVFAGWGVPSQRTVLMLGIVVALQSTGRRWPWTWVLLTAAVGVTMLDPWALLQPGFWLSFVAVALLMVSGDNDAQRAAPSSWPNDPEERSASARLLDIVRTTAHQALRTQVVATISLAPLSAIFFQQISAVGFLANLVAVPWVTLLVTPLALVGACWPGAWDLGAWAVQSMSLVLHAMAAWPGAAWSVAVAPSWAQMAGLLAGVLVVMRLPRRARWWAAPLLLPLLLPAVDRPLLGQFEAVAVDVGQGTAVLLRTRHHLLVYDAGPQYTADRNAGERILLPLLRARGERHIDAMMLSHRDADHVGGAQALMQALPTGALWSSIEAQHPLRTWAQGHAVPHTRCEAGQRWSWDGVHFHVLHPTADDHAANDSGPHRAGRSRRHGQAIRPNTMSCVLRVEDAQGRAMLLTGDIEAAQEQAIVARHREQPAVLRSDVLLVAHHGSRTSSTPAWLQAVQPTVGVVQAGYRNRYGHPAPVVERRLLDAIPVVVRSDRCGAWTRRVDGRGLCHRDAERRYWHHHQPVSDDANE